MADLFLWGGEDTNTAGLALEMSFSANSPTVVASGRNGGSCLRCNSTNEQAHFTLPSAPSTIHYGFAYRVESMPSSVAALATWSDATRTHLQLAITASGQLRFYRYNAAGISIGLVTQIGGTGLQQLVPNVWYWLSGTITIDNTAGAASVYVNDVLDLDLTAQDTQNGGTATIAMVGFAAGYGADIDFDDITISDSGRPLDSRIACHTVTANGTTRDFVPSAGSDDFAMVDDAASDGDATYLTTTTIGDMVTMGLADLAHAGATIESVQVVMVTRKLDASPCSLAPVLRIDGVDNVGASHNPGTGYVAQRVTYMVQPDASAWNETDFNAMEVGLTKVA